MMPTPASLLGGRPHYHDLWPLSWRRQTIGRGRTYGFIAESNAVFVPHELGEDPLGDVSNFNNEEFGYVDFLIIEDILLDSPNNDCDEFYAVKENYLFTRKITIDPFLSIYMAFGRKKVRGKHGKPDVLEGGVWGLQNNYQDLLMISAIKFIEGVALFAF